MVHVLTTVASAFQNGGVEWPGPPDQRRYSIELRYESEPNHPLVLPMQQADTQGLLGQTQTRRDHHI